MSGYSLSEVARRSHCFASFVTRHHSYNAENVKDEQGNSTEMDQVSTEVTIESDAASSRVEIELFIQLVVLERSSPHYHTDLQHDAPPKKF